MKLRLWGIAALALCVLAAGAAPGQAQSKRGKNASVQADDQVDLASYQSVSFGAGPAGAGCCPPSGGWPGLLDRPIQLVAGAEYIYARANFSQALAYVESDLVNGGENWVQYDFDYESGYSFYGGIYLCDCGGAVIFDWTNMTSSSGFTAVNDPPGSTPTNSEIFGPFEVDDNINGFADVDLDTYDLMFSKTIPLGGPMCGGCDSGCDDVCCGDVCCDDTCCGDGCGSCGGCPPWDITWSGGVRFADVSWARGANSYDFSTIPVFLDGYTTTMDFTGFGGRIGLAGRRYFGKKGLFSLYAKGDWSLLVGEINVETLVTNAASSTTAFHRTSCDHIVPVTEIEMGGTVHLGCHANITAGYFWSAWHDLGMREEYDFANFQIDSYDDANILGFDGLFVRGEVTF
ncbi:MAG: hypothetical protein CMJ58_19060 [Planctomycetaceae bacterium]|nr:hypothetical protein [Planctomycetaceae bacterium]